MESESLLLRNCMIGRGKRGWRCQKTGRESQDAGAEVIMLARFR